MPATVTELLSLIDALEHGVVWGSVDDFYALSRAALVKDEAWFDRFDLAFAAYFKGLESIPDDFVRAISEEWLQRVSELRLTEEEKRRVESLGGWEKLMATLRERLAEQKGRHEGGSKWVGTGGTSPFGAYGYNPEGVRIGQSGNRNRRAVKVWDQREFRDYDANREIGVRNVKLALRRLRRFARHGAPEVLDLPGTIGATARNAGWLDLKVVPALRNTVKVLLLLDVGGSMDDHVAQVEELFTAARAEFKNLEAFYFHNCLYESVWRDNHRRHAERTPTLELLHKFGPDWRVVFVGDAAMSPYEIELAGGSVEHWNDEPGRVWIERARAAWPRSVWLNPVAEQSWGWSTSTGMMKRLFEGRMYPVTLAGLESAMRSLS